MIVAKASLYFNIENVWLNDQITGTLENRCKSITQQEKSTKVQIGSALKASENNQTITACRIKAD